MRVLKALRLSSASDASTSIERQSERVDWWAEGNDGTIVGTAEDVGVSGAVAPFDRPGLGPWLTDTPPAQWDVLVAWKLDRISRSAGDTYNLLHWCQKRNRRIVCVDDGIDTATTTGRVFIQIAAIMAEVERSAIQERILSSRDKLRRSGRWPAGTPPFGLVATPREDGGYTLVHDLSCAVADCDGHNCPPEHAAYVIARKIVGDFIDGVPTQRIVDKLNEQKILTNHGLRARQKGRTKDKPGTWRQSTLQSLLRSPALRGYLSHKGDLIYGDDGLPIPSGDRIITEAEWREIQARFGNHVRPRFRPESPLLAGIVYCRCGHRMYGSVERRGRRKDGTPKEYRYYKCADRQHHATVKRDHLDQWAEALFLDEVGDLEQTEEKILPGNHTSARLEEAQNAFEALVSQAGTMRSKAARKKLQEQLDSLDKLLAELEEQEDTPDRTVRVGTGTTFREAWEADTSVEGRRKMLLDAGVRITVESGRPFSADFYVDLNKLRDFIGADEFHRRYGSAEPNT
jgi:DNA invertase Pin-like site-specific DNA recombinase